MRLESSWDSWPVDGFLESHAADFILAFTFFAALAYAVLGKRLEKQRPTIAISAVLGLALSVGLVWWERTNGYCIKDLGPIAIGFALLVLAFVMYQSIRQIGGSWAGAAITVAASILIAQLVGVSIPVDWQILQAIIVVAFIAGVLAFLSHHHGSRAPVRITTPVLPDIGRTMADLYRERQLSRRLDKGLRKLRNEARELHDHPQEASDILTQIKRILPAEGYLTQRMAQLRQKACQMRKGHIARLDETRQAFAQRPPSASKKASAELASSYSQMVGIDTRLERLDRAVAENERRIRQLTDEAQTHTTRYEHQQLCDDLKAAQKLQHHNTRLFKIIERTEQKLSAIATQIAQEVKQVEKTN